MGNVIGKRGGSIFLTIISRYVELAGFLLDPIFLGEKFSTVDFYVHLLNYNNKKAFFFAGVKTTTLGYTADHSKLKVTVEKEELSDLVKYQLPVYLFGIDEYKETSYFICINNLNDQGN